jgi:predicted nucleic acid-binding protein
MPIEWKPAADYDQRRHDAEQRIAARDPDDWPTVALALTLALPVWSQDKDLATAGLDVYTTGDLLDALRDAGHVTDRASPPCTRIAVLSRR